MAPADRDAERYWRRRGFFEMMAAMFAASTLGFLGFGLGDPWPKVAIALAGPTILLLATLLVNRGVEVDRLKRQLRRSRRVESERKRGRGAP